MPLTILVSVILLLLAAITATRAETLINFGNANGWPPYYYGDQSYGGAAVDIVDELSIRSGIKMRTKFFPVKRGRREFLDGGVHMETVIAKAWRSDPADAAVSLWTDVIYRGREVVIAPPRQAFEFDGPKSLKDKRVATVLGYGTMQPEYYRRVDVASDSAVVRLVARGRVSAGWIEENVGRYLSRRLDAPIAIVGEWDSFDYRIRLHISKKHLLRRINDAIAEMRGLGRFTAIIARHVGGT